MCSCMHSIAYNYVHVYTCTVIAKLRIAFLELVKIVIAFLALSLVTIIILYRLKLLALT